MSFPFIVSVHVYSLSISLTVCVMVCLIANSTCRKQLLSWMQERREKLKRGSHLRQPREVQSPIVRAAVSNTLPWPNLTNNMWLCVEPFLVTGRHGDSSSMSRSSHRSVREDGGGGSYRGERGGGKERRVRSRSHSRERDGGSNGKKSSVRYVRKDDKKSRRR